MRNKKWYISVGILILFSMSVLVSYPDRLDGLINIAKLATQMKLGMIGVWSVMLIGGFILKQYSKKKKPLVIE